MDNLEPKIIMMKGLPVYDVRAFYHKHERAKFISHLDLYRTIQRAFHRAKLPIWYTQGFNPHIYLTFALPLSLGYEGMSESFDFRFTTDLPLAEVAQRLNATMPEGITIQTVRPPVRKAGDIDRAEYTLKLSCKDLSPNELSEKLTVFLQQEKIETQKHSKKGMRTIDLKPLILAQKIETADVVNLSLTLPAGTQSNINPTLLTDAFATFEGLDLDYQNICRDRVLCADGTAFI